MPRSRVLSFMSQWGQPPSSPSPELAPSPKGKPSPPDNTPPPRRPLNIDTATPQASAVKLDQYAKGSPQSPSTPSRARGDSRATRPNSMVQAYQPPQVEVANDTPPELAPIFSYLNSHSNKLYQEGYFLKLHDLDSRGRPSPDRTWVECFAQLVGTVLSLWDAAALDAAGEDGEVVPTFINLSDAAIKMIESLPMNGAQAGNLQNVLSISTAANNRYLLHFNSLNSLTQWTAGIRLAMFEHSTLQEAYTGSLIAGKGKLLNNIKPIMERSKFAHEDWARVRFGAGTPWKRCWCVIAPPDEKQFAKAQKTLKKTSAYERVKVPKGDIKFYDTRKVTKKTMPIATVTDAYAAYAIYPQSKPLIDQSTLVKLEGLVTVHGQHDTTTEGFVFVMPEVHPAVTGFEMMLRWLFPVFDAFNLYGRPNRLIADTLDQRGLMFAMPTDRRYGYLDILDVSALIHTDGSQAWSERQWRRELKKLTGARMTASLEDSPRNSRQISGRRNTTSRTSLPPTKGGVRFEEGAYIHSSPGSRSASPVQFAGADQERLAGPRRTDSAPSAVPMSPHKRSVSDAHGYKKYQTETRSRLSYEATSRYEDDDAGPPPPQHGGYMRDAVGRSQGPGSLSRIQSGAEVPTLSSTNLDVQSQAAASPSLIPPGPVFSPPAFTHSPNSRPANQPYQAPELRRAHSNVDAATLYQMQDAVQRNEEMHMPEQNGWQGEAQYRPQNSVSTNTPSINHKDLPADTSEGNLPKTITNTPQRDPRQRLSTIQGSPYVAGDADSFQSPELAFAHAESNVGGGAQQTFAHLGADGGKDRLSASEVGPHVDKSEASSVSLQSSRSIARKPVAKKLADMPLSIDSSSGEHTQSKESTSPSSPVSHESWAGAVIDEDALERILNGSPSRNNTMQSDSTTDYASTVSTDPEEKKKQRNVEKPRTGRLKTVGDPSVPPVSPRTGAPGRLDTWEKDQSEQSAELPSVDFGPTYLYKPNSRPGTSGTITALGERSRSKSADRLRNSSRNRLSGFTPTEGNRNSYFGGRTTPSPGAMTPTGVNASPSGTPGDRSSMAWQPGVTPGGTASNRQSMTAEQWVQYRAALASQPQQPPPRRATPTFGHERKASSGSVNKLRMSLTKTPPPLSRTPSGDWTQLGQQTPPSRPQSRGANAMLGQQSPGATLYTAQQTNLSAREQMHVARAMGQPLVTYTTNADKKDKEQYQPGLFGAVASRQREKEDSIKAGWRNSMHNPAIQQAITARQQQQFEAEAQAQAQAQAKAQAQYQLKMQEEARRQQLQQMQYQQMMAQNQAYGVPQQVPVMQAQTPWQQQQFAGPQGYGTQGSMAGTAGTSSGFSSPFGQRVWEGAQAIQGQQRPQAPNGVPGQQTRQYSQRRG